MDSDVESDKIRRRSTELFMPLSSLDELLEWDSKSPSNLFTASVDLKPKRAVILPISSPLTSSTGKGRSMRTLVCHDMMGGYLEDSYIQGVDTLNTYRFFHWSQVDIFVYFSHNFITIPPPVWIDAAHLHGVPILGTLITEGDKGYELCDKLLNNKDEYLISSFVHQLVQIAEHYKFDGWLINIENKIRVNVERNLRKIEENVKQLLNLIYWLTMQMHKAIPSSLVLWYDSVLENGDLIWQNELNSNNRVFFDACDGIYLNYNWNEELLKKSAELAGDRVSDVYAGVDVFGRGTFGGGGFDTDVAFKAAQVQGLSVAIFGQGWTYEKLGQPDFLENEYKFWNRLVDFTFHRVSVDLPFYSSFCQGFGQRVYRKGNVLHPNPWTNMSLQQYQVINQDFPSMEGNISSLSIFTEEAYEGGSCLRLSGILNSKEQATSFNEIISWRSVQLPNYPSKERRKIQIIHCTQRPKLQAVITSDSVRCPLQFALGWRVFCVGQKFDSSVQVSYTTKCITPNANELEMCLNMTVISSEDITQNRCYHLVQYDRDKCLNKCKTVIRNRVDENGDTVLHPTMDFDCVLVEECWDNGYSVKPQTDWTTRSFCITPDMDNAVITDLDLHITDCSSLENVNTKFEILLGQLQVVPVKLLSDQPSLEVSCLLLETCRSPSVMEVTGLVKWNGGVAKNLVDSYDIFCQLKWTVVESNEEGRLDDNSDQWKAETRYVGSTRRNLYKINSFPMDNPKTDRFNLRFVVRENVIGLATKDINESAYCEATM